MHAMQVAEVQASLEEAQSANQAALHALEEAASDAAAISKAEVSKLQQQLQDASAANEAASSSLQQQLEVATLDPPCRTHPTCQTHVQLYIFSLHLQKSCSRLS